METITRPSDSDERELRIQELLDRWEDARESGDDVSAATLCKTCPELRTELESRIRELRGIDGFIADTLPPDGTRAESSIDPREAEELHGAFGQFEILGLIARGGMGSVYRARQRTPARIVALKVIKSGERSTSHEMRRFHAEAEAAAKLSHPGIVPVYEVGEQDGRHYFTMEFVEGRSLAQLVSEDGPLDSLRAAETMQSVAEAVQYAHERGIVHRDIKPANVLIDTNDRPRVTDFGIAKQLDLDTALTTTGQILGTPDFMSPEQARGNQGEIGTRSDVFSLGVTLYALLTGRSPFRGEDVYSTLRNVIEDEPVSPRSANTQVARDLATICLKCMRKDPAERYASAQELADDLQSYLKDEPISARPMSRGERVWRWCRRNPLPATTAATALCLLLALAIGGPLMAIRQRNLADRADREADTAKVALENEQAALKQERIVTTKLKASLEQNEQTIYQFVQFTKNQRLLRDPRFRPVLKKFLQQALAHYQQFIASHKGDQSPLMRHRLGRALKEVADINYQQGSVEESIKSHRQSLAVYQSLAREYPDNDEYANAVADSRLHLVTLLRETGKTNEAFEEVWQVLKFHERRLDADPGLVEHAFKRAMCHAEIARLHRTKGKPKASLNAFLESQKFLELLVNDHPKNARYQERLAGVFSDMGVLYRVTGRKPEALKAYRRSLKIATLLVRDYPDVATYRSALAGVQNNIGIVLNLTGKRNDALAEFQQAAIIQEQLMRADPTVTLYQTGLTNSLNNIANIYETAGKWNEAITAYRRALKIQERLVKANPTVTKLRSDLADFYYNLSLLYRNTGKRDEELTTGRQSLAIRQKLAKDNPDSTEFQQKQALSLNSLGITYHRSGEPNDALKSHLQCLAIWKRLAELNPAIVVYRSHQAVSHNNIGSVYHDLRRWNDAVVSFHKALALQEPLARKYPKATPYAVALARMNFNISRSLMASARLDEAVTYLGRAAAQYEALRQRSPNSAFYKDSAMRSLWNRAKVYDALGKYREAVRDWRLVTALGGSQYQIFFESRLCRSLAHAGDHTEAAKHAVALSVNLRNADRLYDLVRVFAVSADAAAHDDGLAASRRQSLVREYANQAMALLQRAAGAGFFKTLPNRVRFKTDRDLDSLRNRDDFHILCRGHGVRSYVPAPKPLRHRSVVRKGQ